MIEDLWYKNAVVYSLNLETFMDGNGDGCGDFESLIRRPDWLESLGVDVVWLGPYQPSPNRPARQRGRSGVVGRFVGCPSEGKRLSS